MEMRKTNKLALAWLILIFVILTFLASTKLYDHFQREHSSNYQYRILISKDFKPTVSVTKEKKEIPDEVIEEKESKQSENLKNFENLDAELYEQTKFGLVPKISSNGKKVLDVYSGLSKNFPAEIQKIHLAVWLDDFSKLNLENFNEQLEKLGENKVTFIVPHYAPDLEKITEQITKNGHEFFLQLPTQSSIPSEKINDVSPFLANANPDETSDKLMYLLASVKHAVGIANTTPTLLTKSKNDMNIILSEINKRGLAFLDLEPSNEVIRELSQQINFSFVSTFDFIKSKNNKIENNEKLYINNNVLAIHWDDLDDFIADLKDHKNFVLSPVSYLLKNH